VGTIYVIAFFSGAVVMSFEMLGSRVLAPDFGNSIILWGSLISVFLGGLALGYFLGGQVADRWQSFGGLAALLLVPTLLIGTFQYYGWTVSNWLAEQDMSEQSGTLLASLALFFLPTVFLGTVSPYTVRLLVRDAQRVGRGAGSLYAASTVGSIIGTLVTSFQLILWLGVRTSINLLACILFALAVMAVNQGLLDRRAASRRADRL
jgi:hypothetical protein